MDTIDQANEMRDVWGWAVSWLRKPPASPDKRHQQEALVAALLAEVAEVASLPALHEVYDRDSRWALLVAKREHPRAWPTLGVHAYTAAAFGMRYVELVTGARLDPHHLPAWTGEFAIW